ncbi:MAG TPA: AAC(3) family N-acetyltransferase [Anaerolineae bacterium]|nr:AAC(3) family N-acetyltransferase [Anaerolineae bacterium]
MHHITKEDIKSGLQTLGVKEGSLLGVHSSLSSFGHVVRGANAVLEALFETVGRTGTIVMSTYSLSRPFDLTMEDTSRGMTWKVKRLAFDDLNSPSGMGIIADTFRQRDDVTRWYHPFHSVSAWGKNADVFCQSFKPLVEAGGKILLLGVQMDRCSALHLAEERVQLTPEIIKLTNWEVPTDLVKVYPPEEWLIGCKGVWGDFLIVQEEAEKLGMIDKITIGAATVRLFEAKPMVDLYEQLLRENPYRMFGISNEKAA